MNGEIKKIRLIIQIMVQKKIYCVPSYFYNFITATNALKSLSLASKSLNL